jgi:pSer/pThr/pTyr-binding forkhead associated (FHA) protein
VNLSWVLVGGEGPLNGEQWVLVDAKSLSLGRDDECDVSIKDVNVSRTHATVVLNKSTVMVTDKDSHNGVFVDGVRLEKPTELRVGAKLTVGYQTFVLQVASVESAPIRSLKKRLLTLQGLPEHERALIRYPALFTEALLVTAIALAVVGMLGIKEAGFFGIFLTAASLLPRFNTMLAENKREVFVLKRSHTAAYLNTSKSILAMFLGMCTATLFSALAVEQPQLAQSYGFIFDLVGLESSNLFNRQFSDTASIFGHNLAVSLVIVVLCAFYRTYGALLTLGWNASIWVVVLVTLTRGVLSTGVQNTAQISAMAFVAVTPHLILEGIAYIMLALASIGYSVGLTRYGLALKTVQPVSDASHQALKHPQDEVLQSISMASAGLIGLGLVVLAIAAFVESAYAPWMIDIIKESVVR